LVVLKKVFKPSVILWFKFYSPRRRGFKFIAILNAFGNVRCTEVGSIVSIRSIQCTELGHFDKWVRNTWNVLKFSAGEGWKSVRQIL
jgi:hypothetical protein